MITEKPKITLFDWVFSYINHHKKEPPSPGFASYSGKVRYPQLFSWDRNTESPGDLCVFTDTDIESAGKVDCKHRIAWLLEPREVTPTPYIFLENPKNQKLFDLILTHDLKLLKLIDGVKCDFYYPSYGVDVAEDNFNIHKKSKFVTLPFSFKKFATGHKLRHSIFNDDRFKSLGVDFYKGGYRLYDVIKDYHYSITIENTRDGSLSEKVMTSFLVGTIPIYWGSPKLADYFDNRGFFTFKNEDELAGILGDLRSNHEQVYNFILPYVKENLERAKEVYMVDDVLYTKWFSKFL